MTMQSKDFRSLVEEHQSMVFSIALRIVGERGAAEEVAQDAFLELHAALGKLESADHVRFWLRRVTVNRADGFSEAEVGEAGVEGGGVAGRR
jgi:RNA polymerase sigma-70 factor (ECF subfamily)